MVPSLLKRVKSRRKQIAVMVPSLLKRIKSRRKTVLGDDTTLGGKDIGYDHMGEGIVVLKYICRHKKNSHSRT